MGRPRKEDKDKRDKRLTYYMTEEEEKTLIEVAKKIDKDKTKVVAQALERFYKQLEDPPEFLKISKSEEIMSANSLDLTGFICENSHTFFIQWNWPTFPKSCPLCNSSEIKKCWSGKIKRGLF